MTAAAQACPACAGRLAPWRDGAAGEPGGDPVPLARCAACGTAVTLAPAPADVYETGAYAPHRPRGARLAAPLQRAFDAHRLHWLRAAAPPPARLVDAGAGRGRFVASARAAGYDAIGVEPSRRGVEGARELYDVELVQADVGTAPIEDRSVDVVSLWHVLEHADDPGSMLATVRRWLRPDGLLLVGVPNLASVQARIGGPRWWHLDLPRHRTHFTAAGIRVLVGRSGFHVEREIHVLAEHNPFGFWQSAVSRVTPTQSWLYHALKRNAAVRAADAVPTVAALPLLPLASVVEAAAGAAGRGGTVALLARPRAG